MSNTLVRCSRSSLAVTLVTLFVLLASTAAAVSAAGPTPPAQADPTGWNTGEPVAQQAPVLVAPDRIAPKESLTPMALTGITDPSLISPSIVYDFSGDPEFSSPTTFPGGTFSGTGDVRIVGSTWGSWNPNVPGAHILFTSMGRYEIIFTELQSGVGVVAEPNAYGPHDITIEAFDAADVFLGSFTRSIEGYAGAAFLGLVSDTANIKRVVLTSDPLAYGFAFTDVTYSIAQIFGWLYFDENLNGRRDVGEDKGLPTVLVQLLTPAGAVVQETYSTVPRGWYQFDRIPAGEYCIRAAIPETYGTTSPNPVCFTFDGAKLNVNIGLTQAQATIGDTVYADTNGNGVQDAGEMGYANVTLALWSAVNGQPGAIIATTTTDQNGVYHFMVDPGTYFVQVTDVNGVLGGLTLTAGTNPAGPITVAFGQTYTGADFGYSFVCPANRSILSGQVWEDLNGDATLGAEDRGIAGVQVCANPMSQIYAARCAMTDAEGMYRLCVRPLTYLVAPVVKEGSPIYGLMPIGRAFRLPVVVKPGMQLTDINFGFMSQQEGPARR